MSPASGYRGIGQHKTDVVTRFIASAPIFPGSNQVFIALNKMNSTKTTEQTNLHFLSQDTIGPAFQGATSRTIHTCFQVGYKKTGWPPVSK